MNLFQEYGLTGVAVIDFETTGLNPEKDFPTEVAIKKVGISTLTGKPYMKDYSSKIKLPEGVEVPEFITNLTGLTTEEVNSTGKDIAEVIPEVQELLDNKTLVVAHNSNFDLGFLYHHMGVEPERHMCTRAMSLLTEPDKNASLKNVYARMFGEKEQTHRAGDDVEMTLVVFDRFVEQHGNGAMMFFMNKMVAMPDRELVYTPDNAIVLDFTQKYVSSKTHKKALKGAEKYDRLEAYGVDNWSGYSDAMNDSEGIFE